MNKNKNLHSAKREKNDEFYTQITDIEKEMGHYSNHFKGKIVFCNCDDPKESHFWKYFSLNFKFLGLKKLISTHYDADKPTYKLELTGDTNGDGKVNDSDIVKTVLKQNGDFRSEECVAILKEADIVVTNPPFSLFREYVAQLIEHKKKFIIIGSKNAITYKETFGLIKSNKIWIGHTSPKEFRIPNNGTQKFGNIGWFTNITTAKRFEDITLYKKYYGNEKDYPKYDNYEAINVDKIKEIPEDYGGAIGVPITFLDKYNPKQFKILGMLCDKRETKSGAFLQGKQTYLDEQHKKYVGAIVGGNATYARVIIKQKTKAKL